MKILKVQVIVRMNLLRREQNKGMKVKGFLMCMNQEVYLKYIEPCCIHLFNRTVVLFHKGLHVSLGGMTCRHLSMFVTVHVLWHGENFVFLSIHQAPISVCEYGMDSFSMYS